MNLEKFIKTQGRTAMELLDFGNQREKAEGMGMLRVLKDLEKQINLRRNEIEELEEKQKKFEEKIEALREVREDARKIINRQRKTIKQLEEKNKALTEVD
jgi:chromosome segregation ATPase